MQVMMPTIPVKEALHMMGWRGSELDSVLLEQVKALIAQAEQMLEPRVIMQRFPIAEDGTLQGTAFAIQGKDVRDMLQGCSEAVLLAATLGVQSERMLLQMQARDRAKAVMLDAVFSAAIEAVCDAQECALREALEKQGRYLTDRFSPGYGDMPLAQTKGVCSVLEAERRIGLTVSAHGLMIPRKSVTAIMGISTQPVKRREGGCSACAMREQCLLRKSDEPMLEQCSMERNRA